jgi:hypothetical protein
MSTHCTNCGKTIAGGATQCPRCGASTLPPCAPRPARPAPARYAAPPPAPMAGSRGWRFPIFTYLAAVLPAAYVTVRVYMASPEGDACWRGFFASTRCLEGAINPLFFYWFMPAVAFGAVLAGAGQLGEGGRVFQSFLAIGGMLLTWFYGLAVLVLFAEW